MTHPGIVVLWSNGHPTLEPHRVPSDGLTFGRALVDRWGDDRVSATHARVFPVRGRLVIEDLGSRNGTWLEANDPVLAPTQLQAPALVRFGRTLALIVEDLAPYEGRAIVERHRLVRCHTPPALRRARVLGGSAEPPRLAKPRQGSLLRRRSLARLGALATL